MFQSLSLIHGDLPVGSVICYIQKSIVKKLTPYLFKNDVVLYFEPYWKRENAADINFWCCDKLND